eukprot:801720_1
MKKTLRGMKSHIISLTGLHRSRSLSDINNQYSGPVCLLKKTSKKYNPHWRQLRRWVFIFVMLRRIRIDIELYGYTLTPEQFAKQMPSDKSDRRPTLKKLVVRTSSKKFELIAKAQHMWAIGAKCSLRQRWDHVVLVLILYCLLVLSVRIGFTDPSDHPLWTPLDLALDACFMFDILMNYLTVSSETPTYDEIMASRRGYLASRDFACDVFQCVPFYLLHLTNPTRYAQDTLRLIRWMKVFRVNRFNRVMTSLKDGTLLRMRRTLRDNHPVAHRSASIVSVLLILIHTFACMWYFVSSIFRGTMSGHLFDQSWPEQLGVAGGNSGIWPKYLLSVYWMIGTFSTVGYADAVPRTLAERLFISVVELCALACLAFVTANFTSVITEHDKVRTDLEVRMAGILKFCAFHNFPPDVVTKIRLTLTTRWEDQKRMIAETADVLLSLPESMRDEVALLVYKDSIEAAPFFHNKSAEFVSRLVGHFRPVHYKAGSSISAGQKSLKNWYFLRRGSVIAQAKLRRSFLKLVPNSTMGEIALFIKFKPLYDFKLFCMSDCDLYSIPLAVLSEIGTQFPQDLMAMERVAQVRFKRLYETKKRIHVNMKRMSPMCKNVKEICDTASHKVRPGSVKRHLFKSPKNKFTEMFRHSQIVKSDTRLAMDAANQDDSQMANGQSAVNPALVTDLQSIFDLVQNLLELSKKDDHPPPADLFAFATEPPLPVTRRRSSLPLLLPTREPASPQSILKQQSRLQPVSPRNILANQQTFPFEIEPSPVSPKHSPVSPKQVKFTDNVDSKPVTFARQASLGQVLLQTRSPDIETSEFGSPRPPAIDTGESDVKSPKLATTPLLRQVSRGQIMLQARSPKTSSSAPNSPPDRRSVMQISQRNLLQRGKSQQNMNTRPSVQLSRGTSQQSLNLAKPGQLSRGFSQENLSMNHPTQLSRGVSQQSLNIGKPVQLSRGFSQQNLNLRQPVQLSRGASQQNLNTGQPVRLSRGASQQNMNIMPSARLSTQMDPGLQQRVSPLVRGLSQQRISVSPRRISEDERASVLLNCLLARDSRIDSVTALEELARDGRVDSLAAGSPNALLTIEEDGSELDHVADVVAIAASLGSGRGLVVENSKSTRSLLLKTLAKNGIKCDAASDGETAVFKAKSREYSFILMDIELGGQIDGVSATRQIRDHDLREQRTPAFVFALTGHCTRAALERYAANGFNGAIEKGAMVVTAFMEAMASVHDDPSNFVFVDQQNRSTSSCLSELEED